MEIVFVYVGNVIPTYAKSSLRLAIGSSGLPIRLISSLNAYNKIGKIHGLRFTDLDEFYDRENFSQISKKIVMPKEFREGFWLKTLERFFVLDQFMDYTNSNSIFHAELDQILFNCDELVKNIKKSELKGICLPFRDSELAVASVFYCSDASYLKSFLQFLETQIEIKNEMDSLALWAKNNSDSVWIFPTCATEISGTTIFKEKKLRTANSKDLGGLVDAAQIGQWIAGEDPRNLPLLAMPKVKHVEEHPELLTREQLMNLNFFYFDKNLTVKINGVFYKLYNLHIHSKIHSWLEKSPKNFIKLINISNSKKEVSLLPSWKIFIFFHVNNILNRFKRFI